MRIGIDARLWNQTGVGRYIRNLVRNLAFLDKDNEYYIYLSKDEYDLLSLPSLKGKKRCLDVPWHTFGEQLRVPTALYKDNLDVVHFPYFNVPLFYKGRFLLTVHDLIVDHFDTGRASTKHILFYKLKRLGYKLSLQSAINRASKISVISETTKQELTSHYHLNDAKIMVTYDGLDDNFRRVADLSKPKSYYKFPYILYVGNAYPHKNLERLIAAMKRIGRLNIKLVMAGQDDYFYARLKKVAKSSGIGNNIIFFGPANDTELVSLYHFAKCLVFPSLMEGFGLPNLEAVYADCLPVVSDIPVFREIWGDGLIYFNPKNVGEMADKLLEAINMEKSEYKRRVERLKKVINNYSFKKTARQTLELYEEIYKSG